MLKRSLIALGALFVGTACTDTNTPSAPASAAPPLAPGGALLASRGVPRAGHYIVTFQGKVSGAETPARA